MPTHRSFLSNVLAAIVALPVVKKAVAGRQEAVDVARANIERLQAIDRCKLLSVTRGAWEDGMGFVVTGRNE